MAEGRVFVDPRGKARDMGALAGPSSSERERPGMVAWGTAGLASLPVQPLPGASGGGLSAIPMATPLPASPTPGDCQVRSRSLGRVLGLSAAVDPEGLRGGLD